MVERNSEEQFRWPDDEKLGNGLRYFYKQYITNIQTNTNTWCEKRLENFFRMRCWYRNRFNNGSRFDSIDIRNAKEFSYRFKNLTNGNNVDPQRVEKFNILMRDLTEIGWSGTVSMKFFAKYRWFESLWLFGQMQRQIEVYHSHAEQWNTIHEMFRNNPNFQEPTINRPPKISSFALIPLCDYHLKNVRLDITDLYNKIVNELDLVPSFLNTRTNRMNKRKVKYYTQTDRSGLWNMLFDVGKINKLGKSKPFHHQILTDSVSISIMYKKPQRQQRPQQTTQANRGPEKLIGKKYIIGIDPNEKSWLTVVRRNIQKTPDEPAVEENIIIPNQRFHWETQQKKRDKEAKKLAGWFDIEEKEHLKTYPYRPPSPRNSTWKSYIEYRIKMLRKGMAAYATREYARLDLDHHIRSTRVNDQIAVRVTNNKPSLVQFGAWAMKPDRPFGIKKRKRCPGSRKFRVSIKKLGHSEVEMQDEWGTSQTCANCQERFPRHTKDDRFKVCYDCRAKKIDGLPDSVAGLPDIIVSTVNRRVLRRKRAIIKRQIIDGNREAVNEKLRTGRLMSKVKVTYKNWPLNVDDDDVVPQTVTWHRDIVAAKCIMLKGMNQLETEYSLFNVFALNYIGLCRIFDVPLPVSLLRPPD
ncbi:uncharacterized protein LOC116348610 isoform X1 [Contarinia nasturtii]|uniref:uncharacterized protein LOC116348610 isoform X1 n=1 Tax=Contarinia nasturtii TaxID=265458 RepID=UPI0012D4441B|nr:uncharacterized protein LOC116348610 isoform X1 [Contarinia nasturtii]